MAMKLTGEQFEQVVERAIARLPDAIRLCMENLVVIVEETPSPELLAEVGVAPEGTLFGLYTGIPLPQRSAMEPPLYPDEIVIFKGPLEAECPTIQDLEAEIEITLAHEVAHFVGIGEEQLTRLGYA